MRGERLDAEALRRVVAGCDQVDAELPRCGEARLLGLAGEERVEALVRGADQVVAGRAGRDGEALDPLRAVGEDERLAVERVGDARRQLRDREAVERAGDPDAAERALRRRADPARELRGVAELAWASRARW